MAILRVQGLVLLAFVIVLALAESSLVDATKHHHHHHYHHKKTAKKTVSTSGLSTTYYDRTCPGGVNKIYGWVEQLVKADKTLPAAWTRVQFHDCFVRGCEASILINNSDPNTEVNARPNLNSIRGFTQLDIIKSNIEAVCPGIVSCADIIALASRDSIQVLSGGKATWEVALGRKDGFKSLASEANAALPAPFGGLANTTQKFAAVGLNVKDMVVLSGGHTIGFTHCAFVTGRLYNFSGSPNGVDPSLDPAYANVLKAQCPNGGDATKRILMEPTSGGETFDKNYFDGVLKNKGAFNSDATLKNSQQSLNYLNLENSSNQQFFEDFGQAMIKMGEIGVLTGSQGNVRKVCSKFN